MKTLQRAAGKLSIVGELFTFLWEQKLWWMIPMVAVLAAFGLLLVFTQGSAIAPFVYTLF
jgi:NAD/NADP transhydrogenase beta subunit